MSKEHLTLGILAHVDSGKTTLAESLLFQSGSIRKLGRVDHGDAFLDNYTLEQKRGITIFSKQAEFELENRSVTLLDTPGHIDFSAEMERTLQVLDYGILVISGADGIQGHTETLWRLLSRYQIPVFIFVNKMDQPGTDREQLLIHLKKTFGDGCVDFSQPDADWEESIAMTSETLLEKFLETGTVERKDIQEAIARRTLFPCYFGSALKVEGVREFMQGLEMYTRIPDYGEDFGAKVYKISRDAQGGRLTHMKITGGRLKVKMLLEGEKAGKAGHWEAKVDQIRIYSGAGYETVNETCAGHICAVTGLNDTWAGEGLGAESAGKKATLEPVLSYEIQLQEGTNVHEMFLKLKQLEEEDPQLQIVWDETLGEIHSKVMGEIQIEILKSLIEERFGVSVEFGAGSIVYKETIRTAAEGVGHYEPLRHYAEVHLWLEPGEPGSGLVFDTQCSEDVLDRNWQRLILTHLMEKSHRGVLTGAAITDMKISLVGGRAHAKHTEGGDFRQATYRALRQGLRQCESTLLEPVYRYRLEVPADKIGRAMADVQRMQGDFLPPETEGEMAVLEGRAPVLHMRSYGSEVAAYTQGRGRFTCRLDGYAPCHNSEAVIEAAGYDPEADLENPTGSVFCAHGAGFNVPWDQVCDYMHVENCVKKEVKEPERTEAAINIRRDLSGDDDEELKAIFERTYGPVKRRQPASERVTVMEKLAERKKTPEDNYLLVDGYNIIFSWEELKELAEVNIASARNALMDILSNYQGFRRDTLILVFDAYKVEGNPGQIYKYHNIYVVFTKEAETADQYIEKTVHRMGRSRQVTVATSDALEQVIILGQGARRFSAQDLKQEVEQASREIREILKDRSEKDRNYLLGALPEELVKVMEDVRLGKKSFEQEET